MVVDPENGRDVPLYNPRTNSWQDHFRWENTFLLALTSTGKATIEALDMNRPLILAIRHEETLLGRHSQR